MHARAACLFLGLIADSKIICTSNLWAANATPISQLKSILGHVHPKEITRHIVLPIRRQ